ncbi:MAG TPA: HAMP domain-containing sensor histidine kinase [Thermoanaerobaculia bacterium]|nr:HAMP domain-containing sensor histidine kinase [Thermoanaerobaculia bacterium]
MRTHWHHRRRRHGPPPFVRRFGCFFGALLVLAAIGAATAARLNNGLAILLVAILVTAGISAAFALAFRRVSRVFRAQDALRRQLLADVAHELRTPLAILQGRVEGLLDGVYPRDDAHLSELLDETHHLSRLVEDLRTIANAEAGVLELQKERVDAAELIRDAAASFESVSVDVRGPIELDLDPVRIRAVLLNLLSNAVRAGGAVRVSAEAQPSPLVIRVADTGSGIPAEELPRIFDRFVKGRDSRGSGLGLAIAKNLVEAHGGTIRAESRVGEGTTITVTLPM